MQVLGALAEMRGTGAVLLFHAESEVEEAGADREDMGQLGECFRETSMGAAGVGQLGLLGKVAGN